MTKTGSNLTESFKESCGSNGVVLLVTTTTTTMMMI
jgi:hypothetical protein